VAVVTSKLGEPLPSGEFLVDGDLGDTEYKGVELGVARASAYITYNGVAAQGEIATTVIIDISPGSELYIDIDQSGRLRHVKTEDDQFRGEVRLQRGKEWVYYKTVRPGSQDEAEKFFRLNIYTKIEERLTRDRFITLLEEQ